MVTPASRAAIDSLLDRRRGDGLWSDFRTLAGESDEWVSAYVAAALGGTDDDPAVDAARTAWRRLVWRRPWSAGWGYSRRVPADADTTAWALRLSDRVGATARVTRWRARRFLRRHVDPDGGISTFRTDGPIRRFTGLARDVSFAGWCRPHPSVTAAAVDVLPRRYSEASLAYLRDVQLPDGSWPSYWWPDRAYATALAAAALDRTDDPSDSERVDSAVEWAVDRIGTQGAVVGAADDEASAFDTAWCVRLLGLAGRPADSAEGVTASPSGPLTADGAGAAQPRSPAVADAARRAVRWLRDTQRADGTWKPSTWLRIPPPDVVDPATYRAWEVGGLGGGSVQTDQHATMTTATVLAALESATWVDEP